ncbi:MAG: RNA polymerase sigma factor [Proteobacteria bacterium]|nr:RNA polymerase sigma factor [Pseudomonadota bacterium]MBU1641150.1 RNA polymerase sigma factor [Pseudomonadota bacterium]
MSFIHSFSKTADFESIVRPHMLRLYRVAYRLTGNSTDAEDLVQDVLVKLYPKERQLLAIETLGPWLAKVLYRTFLDQQRRNKRSPLHLVAKGANMDADILDFIASPQAGPEEGTEQKETHRRLQAAINSLNPDQRHLCLLYYVEGYTLAELEEILDTPLGTLKSRIHRSRDALRNFLNQGTISSE